jgi:8-oxo-dGTP pyrophosphatase MutT (NUDIX family)
LDKITQVNYWEGRRFFVTWHASDFIPTRNLVVQAGGICFTDEGKVVVVTADGKKWNLPGGHTEQGETVEEAFIREVREEACATVIGYRYLGSQEVTDPENPETLYYQAGFWAHVRLDEFIPEYEIIERKQVTPEIINESLQWDPDTILEVLMKAAVECENKYWIEKHK